jgi:hypothetical protein
LVYRSKVNTDNDYVPHIFNGIEDKIKDPKLVFYTIKGYNVQSISGGNDTAESEIEHIGYRLYTEGSEEKGDLKLVLNYRGEFKE